MSRIEQIGVECDGQAEGDGSRSRRTGSRLFDGRCCLGPETVADYSVNRGSSISLFMRETIFLSVSI